MLKLPRILVTLHVLAACAVMLPGCGQKGPLVLPTSAESAQRATLPETLNPLRKAPDQR
jgi:predicted small lipoprotein YifL